MLCSAFSTRLMISRSTVSGEAPGYGIATTITGCCTSGIWFTRRFFSASNPRHISVMMMTTVATGRLMLKSDRTIGLLRRRHRGLRGRRRLHRLPVLQERRRVADHAVALGKPARDHVVAGARVALGDAQRHLLQLAVLHAEGRAPVAVAHDGGGGNREARMALGLQAPLGVQAREP